MDIPYFVQNFLLALLAYMESAATHLTLTFISLLLHTDTVLQAYTLIECLEREVFDERYAVYLYIIDLFAPNSTDLVSFASDDGTYIMTVNADDAVTDFPPFKHFCTSTFLMMERRL